VRILQADRASGQTTLVRQDTDPAWVDIVGGVPDCTADGRIVWTADAGGAKRLVAGTAAEHVAGTAQILSPVSLNVVAVHGTDGDTIVFTATENGDAASVALWAAGAAGLTRLSPAESAALSAAYARLTADLDQTEAPRQALHGDAGPGNLMNTDTGWVWHDFEDTCCGPVAWDLAASTASQRLDGQKILAAYGAPVDPAPLAVCERLRLLHLTIWYALYAERLPDLRPRAAELLALWTSSG